MEQWRPVVGYGGYYEVSDAGRVRSCDRVVACKNGVFRRLRGSVLSPCLHPRTGHRLVNLCRDGESATRKVHQLVLEAHGSRRPSPQHEGLHWDNDPGNNTISNLRWGTRSDNMFDLVRQGAHRNANTTRCPANHELRGHNLALGYDNGVRTCRSCSNARSAAFRARRKGLLFDVAADADRRYELFMAAS